MFFSLMLRRPPTSTLFPSRRSSDLRERSVSRAEGEDRNTDEIQHDGRHIHHVVRPVAPAGEKTMEVAKDFLDRKSTRLNSSHTVISYAVFCLKKKKHVAKPQIPRSK